MPNKNKQLGVAFERTVVERAKRAGLEAERQPLSGALKQFPNDVRVKSPVVEILVEAKKRTATLSAGEKCITINLDWLKGVVANAAQQASGGLHIGVVTFAAKGACDLYCLLRYEDLLALLQAVHENGG
jgi:Holliday junction resolvase